MFLLVMLIHSFVQRSTLDAEAKSKREDFTAREAAIKAREGIVLSLADD